MRPFLAYIMPVGDQGPVDPGYGRPGPIGGGPVDPGWSGGIGNPGGPGRPDHGLPPFPSHPIAPGGQPPLGIWGPGFPYPDQGLPGSQPRPDHGLPPFPSHPIAPGGGGGHQPGQPGGPVNLPSHGRWVWSPVYGWVYEPGSVTGGGGSPPHPDQGLPGQQPHPDHTLPGQQPHPDQGLPGSQPHPDQGLPGSQPKPDQGLPPTPEPKDPMSAPKM